jgi:hypothetical protein
MNNRKCTLTAAAIVLILTGIACNLPTANAPTPFVFPTPDLTLTAIYSVLITPTPPLLVTATAVQIPPTSETSPTVPPILGTFIPETPILPTLTTAPPTPVPLSPTPARLMRPGPVVEAPYMHNPPSIDGNLNEWSIPLQTANHIVFGRDRWDNPEDLSSRFMVGWDFNYLYLAARVTDEDYVQNARGEDLFLGDSLEILMDNNLARDFDVTRLGPDNYQLGISPGNPEPGQNPEAYLWFPREKAGSRPEVRIAAQRSAVGWDVETAIPWSVFDLAPQAEMNYGFVFSVSDNDRTGQVDQQTMVSNVSTRRLSDPTTWGNLTLRSP